MKTVFLDRDGTIIKNIPYLKDPEKIQFEHRAIPALRLLEKHGFSLIIITNQSGIGRGLISEKDYKAVEKELKSQLKKNDIHLLDSYYCPFHPSHGKDEYKKDSEDRKPNPGMILKAVEDHNISCENSFMIGDRVSDVEAGKRASVKSILVRTGYGQEESKFTEAGKSDYIAEDLYDAVVNFIIP